MFASRSTRGFYYPGVNVSMPADVVTLPEGLYAEIMAGQSEGKIIEWAENGFPFLSDAPPPTTDQMWNKIKFERDRRKDLGVLAAGHWFHSDSASRIQQLALVIMGANMPAGIQWKTMGDEYVLMTPTLAGQIFNATATLDQVLFSNATAHRTAMLAAAVPSEYDFSTGWPDFYQE
jgi:hypothetical protein